MNRLVSTLVMAFAGAAAASLLTVWRKNQVAEKAFQKEAIQRWEDDGGNIPVQRSRAPAH